MKPKKIEKCIDVLVEHHVEWDDQEEQEDVCKKRYAKCFSEIIIFIAIEKIVETAEDNTSHKCRDERDDDKYEWQERIDRISNSRTIDRTLECLRKHAARKEQDDENKKCNDHSYSESDTCFRKYLPSRIIVRFIIDLH